LLFFFLISKSLIIKFSLGLFTSWAGPGLKHMLKSQVQAMKTTTVMHTIQNFNLLSSIYKYQCKKLYSCPIIITSAGT